MMRVAPQGALYVLPVLRSITYLCLKICSIALSKKLLDEVLQNETDPELYQQLDEDVLASSQDSFTTRIFLMDGMDFYGVFAVTSGLVLAASIIHPIHTMMAKFRFNFQEVKRLQTVLYKYFILQTNSVAIKEANDLLYTKIPIVEKYWARAKYEVVGDLTACFVGMLLTIILAWDLGLMYMGALLVVFVGSDWIRTKMSTPWDEQRERKQAATNAHLTDLVLCKELIITNAQETNEFDKLKEKIKEDEEEIRRLSIAHLVAEFVECSTFFMFTPLLFLFVFTVDPSLERLFQMLVLLVITDEVVRSYLAYSKNRLIVEEYNRAQQDFCNVLGMSKDLIFPPDIVWPQWISRATSSGKKHNSSTQRTDDPTDYNLQTEVAEDAYESYLLNEVYCSSSFTMTTTMANNFFAATPESSTTEEMILSNMALGYQTLEGRNFCAIDGLNLSLELGEHYSIMGESGAGKSTILKCLAGLVPPLYGTITARGKELETTSVPWREQVAVVSQTSVLFNRTLKENLCYGSREEVLEDRIFDVLDSVNLKDRVMGLPEGLDTMILKNGHEFSGGQLQRLSIAHLLLSSKNCTLVLMDEPTSALDSFSMDRVCEILRDFLKGKTLVLVTHDLEVADALSNRVFNIKAGGEIEKGFISCESNGHLVFHGENGEARQGGRNTPPPPSDEIDTSSKIAQLSAKMREQALEQMENTSSLSQEADEQEAQEDLANTSSVSQEADEEGAQEDLANTSSVSKEADEQEAQEDLANTSSVSTEADEEEAQEDLANTSSVSKEAENEEEEIQFYEDAKQTISNSSSQASVAVSVESDDEVTHGEVTDH